MWTISSETPIPWTWDCQPPNLQRGWLSVLMKCVCWDAAGELEQLYLEI